LETNLFIRQFAQVVGADGPAMLDDLDRLADAPKSGEIIT
jgi:hypothetical protein